MKTIGSIIVFTAMILSSSAWAQPTARITTMHAVRGNSQAQLTLHVKCDDVVQYQLSASQLSIIDNGEPVEEFTITESSSPAVRNVFSTAIVLDASGSMSGAGNAGAKAAASAFVSFMDSVADEAAVFYFNSTPVLMQTMTTSKALLQASVSQLPASGATAVWDAMYEGIVMVANSGVNSKKSVVVLTDGADNSSSHTPSEVILLAQQKNIRVFTIGLGASVNSSTLEMIALLSGGLFYQTPTASELQNIFTTIASFMGRGFDEHTVAYVTPSPDAEVHTLEVRVQACNDVTSTTNTEAALTGTTAVKPTAAAMPTFLALEQNIPNPFENGSMTVIPYSVRGIGAHHVTLEVFDLLGLHVATLVDGLRAEGTYNVRFDANDLARGMYLYRLSSEETVLSRMMLIR